MEIRPILSALSRNWVGALLVALQVAITMAVMVNAVFVIQERTEKIARPTGVDESSLAMITIRVYEEDYDWKGNLRQDIERLAALPGVESVSTTNTLPGIGSGWMAEWHPVPDDHSKSVTTAIYAVDHNILDTLGIELSEGRPFREDEVKFYGSTGFEDDPQVIILSRSMADQLFPDGGAVGGTVYTDVGQPVTVIGIVEHLAAPWPNYGEWTDITLLPARENADSLSYVVRTEPGQAEAMLPVLHETLQAGPPGRVARAPKTLREMVDNEVGDDRAMVRMLLVIIALLVAVTALGIVGLASFNVGRRTRQIGTRRAMGATRGDILRYFMVENALITGIGVALGTVLTFLVNRQMAEVFSIPRLDPMWLPAGILALLALGQLAVLFPARRATRVPPAVATRTV